MNLTSLLFKVLLISTVSLAQGDEEAEQTEVIEEAVEAVAEVVEVSDAEFDEDREMPLQCPKLSCEENSLEPNICYVHDGKASASLIRGALCFDAETARQTDKPLVCPFNTVDYMWIDELLQG